MQQIIVKLKNNYHLISLTLILLLSFYFFTQLQITEPEMSTTLHAYNRVAKVEGYTCFSNGLPIIQ